MRQMLAFIFFLSGASALVFESLWFRLAGLSLGNSVWSASLVLAAFMGGLALGNGLVARYHARVRRPVRLYAGIEFAIGFAGLAVVLLLPLLQGMFGPLLGAFADMPMLLNAVRVLLAFVILVTPAIAMGATLPVLAKAMSRYDRNFGRNIGWLYGWNTFGAMFAAIGTELVLVPLLGIVSSGFFALALNLVAALIALRIAETHEAEPMAEPAIANSPVRFNPTTRRYIVVAFLSGALMLALEVVWFRFLLLTLGGTSVIFGVMLAVVLGGIALGGLVAAHLFRRDEHAYRWLRHVTAASAAFVVLTYAGYDLFEVYSATENTTIAQFVWYSIFLMLPVATLSGIAFTMVNRAVKDGLGTSARTAGIATLANTVGAMLGSLAGGFILLPVLGMEWSFFLLAALYALVALLVPRGDSASRRSVLWGRGVLATAAVSLLLFPFGLMQQTHFDKQAVWLPGHSLITTREGLTETLRYYQRDFMGEAKYHRLVTNGYSMSATTTAAKRYMKLYVYLPLALNHDTEDALLISYGVGSTAKALTDSQKLQRIDVVDISEDILDLSTVVYPGDDNPLLDDRVHVHVEDGRFYLNSTERRYDLITSEPPPPKNAGIVNLYSEEYFTLIRDRLNEGGYASYWLPVQQLLPTDTLAITKAFCNAFEDCSLWSGAGLEWMLLGSNGADEKVVATDFAAQWKDPGVAAELVALGLESPAQMGSLFMADHEYLDGLTGIVRPVTDNFPSRISSESVYDLEYVELYDMLMHEGERLERFQNSAYIGRIWPDRLIADSERYFRFERAIKNHFTAGVFGRSADGYRWEIIDDALTNSTLTTLPLWLLGSDASAQQVVDRLLAEQGYTEDLALELARRFASQRDFQSALGYVDEHIRSVGEVTEWVSQFYLYLLAKNGRLTEASSVISQVEGLGRPDIDRFLDWYFDKFGLEDARQDNVAVEPVEVVVGGPD